MYKRQIDNQYKELISVLTQVNQLQKDIFEIAEEFAHKLSIR